MTTTHTHSPTKTQAPTPQRRGPSFEDFQASGHDVDDICAEVGEGPIAAGRVYMGDLYLETVKGGWRVWIGHRPGKRDADRAALEQKLYDYGMEYGAFESGNADNAADRS